MSITDELRKYVEKHALRWADNEHPSGGSCALDPRTSPDMLRAIADRIDTEHEKALRELNDYASASILLPKDADGEYIHIGDMMECDKLPNGNRVCGEVKAISNDCVWLINVQYKIHAEYLRHHHEPTVEDVLREFAGTLASAENNWGSDVNDAIAEYAAKLQLKERK